MAMASSSSRSLFLLVVLCSYSLSLSAIIQWTGNSGTNIWSDGKNWNGNQVPTANDIVVINATGGSQVTIGQPATAYALEIGGGAFGQQVTLQQMLSLGNGGLAVRNNGRLSITSNIGLPLSSSGPVNFYPGANIVFSSGAFAGPGIYTVYPGATLLFSQLSLKGITTTVVNNGQVTLQSSAIQFSQRGSLINWGNITALGSITIVPGDTSAVSITNYGGFAYQGNDVSSPFRLQVPAYFYSDLVILAGEVTIESTFSSNSSVSIPSGGVLSIDGNNQKTFNVIKGTGEFYLQGVAIVSGPVSVSYLTVDSGGNLTVTGVASFATATITGLAYVHRSLNIGNLTIAGGSLYGAGQTIVSANLQVVRSATGVDTANLYSTLLLYGIGVVYDGITFLFGPTGLFHIAPGSVLNVRAPTSYFSQIQGGTPHFTVDGTLLIRAGPFLSNQIAFDGAGVISLTDNAVATFQTSQITVSSITVAASAFAYFQSIVIQIDTISGKGGISLSALQDPVSQLGLVDSLGELQALNGVISINRATITTLNNTNAEIKFSSASANIFTDLVLGGGKLSGQASITTSTLSFQGNNVPITISGLKIKTNYLYISSRLLTSQTIQYDSGAAIIAGN